jgi:hypothetical protein
VIAGHLRAELSRAPMVAPQARSFEGTEVGMRT